jgi:hypothetical protein
MFTNVYDLFTIVYMTKKSVYSFRLSDEVRAILEQQVNPVKFVEDLILGKTRIENVPWLDLEKRVDDVLQEVKKISTPKGVTGRVFEAPASSERDRFVEEAPHEAISRLEAERDEKLEFVQDPQEVRKIGEEYQAKIDEQWRIINERQENSN